MGNLLPYSLPILPIITLFSTPRVSNNVQQTK